MEIPGGRQISSEWVVGHSLGLVQCRRYSRTPFRIRRFRGVMARLCIKSEGFDNPLIELRLGVNRLGRSPGNDFPIDHPTISAKHCEILLSENGVRVRDCNSTNGTFVDGRQIGDQTVSEGQVLRLGDVELLVESTEFNIAIPKFDIPRPAPPIVRSDGSLICPRHPGIQALYQCSHCHEVLCGKCVHRLRRRGGKMLLLCPVCSHACALIGGDQKKKRNPIFALLRKTIRLPFSRSSHRQ